MICPLFRCLPSDPKAKIDYRCEAGMPIEYKSKVFDRMMLDLDPKTATWEDCRSIVAAYNRLCRERAWLS